jgi:hypothetical protein
MDLNETYSKVRIGKNRPDVFPTQNGLKKRYALSQLLFNFALEYVIGNVQAFQEGLELHGTHHLLVYNDDAKLGGNIDAVERNSEDI